MAHNQWIAGYVEREGVSGKRGGYVAIPLVKVSLEEAREQGAMGGSLLHFARDFVSKSDEQNRYMTSKRHLSEAFPSHDVRELTSFEKVCFELATAAYRFAR